MNRKIFSKQQWKTSYLFELSPSWGQSAVPTYVCSKGTDAQPTVIKSWKEKERDLDFRPENTIIASVLSSFSLSLFNVIQDLMSSIHFCIIERKRSGIWWGGCRLLELRVVSVWVMKDGVLFNYSRKRSCIENEKDRSKDWSLWNTERDGS